MKGLKGKIIIIMVLATILLGGLGYFSLTGLFELTDRISHLAEPTGKWRRFQKITTDLSKLNSVFVLQGIDAEESFGEGHLPLIDSIKVNIAELKEIYEREESFDGQLKLDTIPLILDQIKDEFKQVNELRTRNQGEVYQNLEKELLQRLGELSVKDSLLIVEKISYEVRKRNVPDSIFVPREGADDDKSTFLQRLFGKERPREDELVIQQREVIEDTVVVTQSDTLLLSSSDGLRDDEITEIIRNAFTNYYKGEVELMEKIRETEQNFYAKNAGITAELETLINDLRYKETIRARNEAERTYEFSRRYQVTIIGVIAFFFLSSMVLVYFSLRDINKNRRFQQQIIQSEKKAKREAKAKQEFLSTMSHELRTPLTSIIGFAEMLDSRDENAKSIQASSQHLLHVANEILDTAKVEAGIIEINQEVFDLSELLHNIRRSFEGLISDKGLEPDFDLPDEEIWIESDSHRISQVLYNLLHNALKFTESGTIGMQCRIEDAADEHHSVSVAVRDTGIGIPRAEQETVFDQYHQAGTHKNKIQGTGLGLGIVKKVVGLMGGEIRLESEPNVGSTFTLMLTLKKADKADAPEDADQINPSALNGLRVYCIDDDSLITKLYERIFSKVGAEVLCETDPLAALEHLKHSVEKYDAVISDVKMPKLNGYQLLSELESGGLRPKVIIASTANVLQSDSDKDELKRFDAVISKPLNTRKLIGTVAEMTGVAGRPTAQKTDGGNSEKEEVQNDDSGGDSHRDQALYSLKEYEAFAMGDEDFIKEIIQDLIAANEKELKQAFELLRSGEKTALAEIIHKMSSRFAQLRVTDKGEAKELELALRAGEERMARAEKLLDQWQEVHRRMCEDFGEQIG